MKLWPMMFVALGACGDQSGGNAATANISATNAVAPAAPKAANCDVPKLDFRTAELKPTERAAFESNFRAAFDRACADGLIAEEPLVDPRVYDKDTIFVLKGSEANIPSFYFAPSGAPPSMLLEWPRGAMDDSPPQIPSADDLHEAIYCAIRGATPEEEEKSGRCLPD